MSLLKVITLAALILICTTCNLVAAPVIHVDDPQGSFTPVGLTFSFTSDGAGGGLTNFTNTSGVTFTTLEIYVAAPLPLLPIVCGGNAYVHCWQDFVTEGGFATIDFFGGIGIPNGMAFDVDLGASGWTPNATFFAFANEPDDPATPEPGMLTLFASGLGAIWLRYKSSAK
jgi:hypothetical protein